MIKGVPNTNLQSLAEGGYINYDPGDDDRDYLQEFQDADAAAVEAAGDPPEDATHSVVSGTPAPEGEENDLEVDYI